MVSEHGGDVFEDVLNLEEQYYSEGYNLGVADGSKSGRIEGRIFGLQKGFEKFIEMGKLNGRAAVWEARLPQEKDSDAPEQVLPPIQGSDRLRKHVERLAALSNPDDLSTTNGEDEVSEFDDRLKDAKAKARLIERLVGEDENSAPSEEASEQTKNSSGRALRIKKNEPSGSGRATGEMEDFLGLPSR